VVALLSLFLGYTIAAYHYTTAGLEPDNQAGTEQNMYSGAISGLHGKSKVDFSEDIDFDLFWEVWDSVKANYVDKDGVTDKKLFYGAIKGMVDAIEDPYTVFMDPIIAKEFDEDLTGTFEGIGAEIGIKNDILTVIAPLPDMPAAKAGLQPGDKILAINGTSTMGISIDQAVRQIRGPKDSTVTLTISRDGMEEVTEIVITRGTITVESVRMEMLDSGIYKIKVTDFHDDTIELFNVAVREILEKNPKGVILDLRSNPGGYLEASIEMSSEWVEEGVVVIEAYSDDTREEKLARGRARLKDFPTVVLVNQGSASASEIVAGALKDHEKAKIVGEQTYGKGSVQSLARLEDGSSLKITTAKWLTPNGSSINEEGITPDVNIELTIEDYNNDKDPQLDAAVAILLGTFDYSTVKTEDTQATSTEN